MMDILLNFGPWIVGILGALFGVVAINKSAKAKGKAEGEKVAAETIANDRERLAADAIRKADAAAEFQGERVSNAIGAKDEVNRLPSGGAAGELRDNWTRD